ncbi:hypothetical protein ACRALDRAFT_2031463 [Sodiomyces alcalophilus JCM 7366]|uniref:uncharacterized protein n=1 Tax=Sodiomyces alcalophilus JCM 7366 TaxID=591952 RepID=UPI0039B4BF5C
MDKVAEMGFGGEFIRSLVVSDIELVPQENAVLSYALGHRRCSSAAGMSLLFAV